MLALNEKVFDNVSTYGKNESKVFKHKYLQNACYVWLNNTLQMLYFHSKTISLL